MARVTAEEVKEIIDDVLINDLIIDNLISAASELITEVFINYSMSDIILKEIERWLVAHMVASTPLARTAAEEKIGDAAVKYTGKYGEGLKSTPYGQMVLTLDFSGKMAKLGKLEAKLIAVQSFEE